MAKHRVLLESPPLRIRKKRTIIRVKADDAKIGQLEISAAGIRWKVGNNKPVRLPWEDFADLMAKQKQAES